LEAAEDGAVDPRARALADDAGGHTRHGCHVVATHLVAKPVLLLPAQRVAPVLRQVVACVEGLAETALDTSDIADVAPDI